MAWLEHIAHQAPAWVAGIIFLATALLTIIFLVRQIFFSLHVHHARRESPYRYFQPTRWPSITILIPAHNEEKVLDGCLAAMNRLDYPDGLLEILVINDRSTDGTRAIAERWQERDARMRVLNRAPDARPGKPAAIKEAMHHVKSDVIVFFDADYVPMPPLLKQLVAPFVDPQVGATMGRVIPHNTNHNLLTKLVDLERRGGYVVDQTARGLLNLLPQFGGTVGAVRMSALQHVGGWNESSLAEDTDLTYRLFLAGWTVEYLNHAVCYEETPVDWRVRFRQVRRWAYGHNECMLKYLPRVLTCDTQPLARRIDASIVLLFYLFPVISLLCLITALVYPVFYAYPPINMSIIPAFSLMVGFGNFSPYFQILVSIRHDRQQDAARLLPLIFISSLISMLASTSALALLLKNRLTGGRLLWDKTVRFGGNA